MGYIEHSFFTKNFYKKTVSRQEIFDRADTFLKEAEKQTRPPLLIIVGPTSSGKTALSLELARLYNGEIISADSRQLYIGMDIGTDKISKELQAKIPHHMIDVVTPDRTLTLFEYKTRAEHAIRQIQIRHRLPILIGGTGLYLSAITENYQIPKTGPDFALRYQLMEDLKKYGEQYMHDKLKEMDPESAAKIDPRNHHYLLRALEININTKQQKKDLKGEPKYFTLKIGLNWQRENLYKRIDARVDAQIERGLIEETRLLLEQYDERLPSMSSLGYPQIAKYLKGELTIDEALELLKKETRNYAKRQLTWFNRDHEIQWFEGEKIFEENPAPHHAQPIS